MSVVVLFAANMSVIIMSLAFGVQQKSFKSLALASRFMDNNNNNNKIIYIAPNQSRLLSGALQNMAN